MTTLSPDEYSALDQVTRETLGRLTGRHGCFSFGDNIIIGIDADKSLCQWSILITSGKNRGMGRTILRSHWFLDDLTNSYGRPLRLRGTTECVLNAPFPFPLDNDSYEIAPPCI